jgi:ArsR family transcriptional regulator
MISPAQVFKCLSDDTRLRYVTLLKKEGKLVSAKISNIK